MQTGKQVDQRALSQETTSCVATIESKNYIVVSAECTIRLFNASDLNKPLTIERGLKNEPDDENGYLTSLDTGATSIGVSDNDEYMAVGTRKGTVKLYETDYLKHDIYLSMVEMHEDIVMDIGFQILKCDTLMITVA